MEQYNLELLKDKYWNIYKSDINGTTYIWRELSRAEWNKAIRYYSDPYEREDYVLRTCILEPDINEVDIDKMQAGIITSLVLVILKESGFGSEPTNKITSLMDKYDAEMKSFQHQISCIITEAFPTLNIEEVEDWPVEKTIWYYSRAKYKIEALRGIELVSSNENSAPQLKTGANIIAGDMGDFPELRQQQAFMKGKL